MPKLMADVTHSIKPIGTVMSTRIEEDSAVWKKLPRLNPRTEHESKEPE